MSKDKKTSRAIEDTLDQFDDDLWVELITTAPESMKSICYMLTLDLQLEHQAEENYGKNNS